MSSYIQDTSEQGATTGVVSEEHASYMQPEPEQWAQPDAYVVTVPHETTSLYPGRTQAVAGLVCAAVSVAVAPVVLGPAGIALGVVARKKGARTFGLVTVLLAMTGTAVGVALEVYLAANDASMVGYVGAVRWLL